MFCAVPPRITPTWTVVKGGSKLAASSVGAAAQSRRFSALPQSISRAACMIALTPRSIIEECTSWPCDMDREHHPALVAGHAVHHRRLADDHRRGLRQPVQQVRDHQRRAEAADLLVMGQHDLQRPLHPGLQRQRHRRQRQRVEALHVAGAAAIEPAVALGQHERDRWSRPARRPAPRRYGPTARSRRSPRGPTLAKIEAFCPVGS